MPYNLTLNSNSQFSPSSNNQPNVQDWSFSPAYPINITHTIGEDLPSDIDILCNIKDYVAASGSSDYEFYIKHIVNQSNPQQNLPDMISLSGNINDATGDGFQITSVNLEQTVTLSFINLQIVAEGNYNNVIGFQVYRKNTITSEVQLYDVRFYQVNITVENGDPFFIAPDNISIVYVSGLGTNDSQDLEVTATGNFNIYTKDYLTLSGGNLVDEGIVQNWLPGPGATRKYSGSNSQTITVDGNTELNDFDQGYYDSQIKLENGNLYRAINVQTIVFDTDETTTDPSSLSFYAVKGFLEAESQQISIVSPYPFTITTPSWLNSNVNSGVYFLDLDVVPLLSNNLSEGVYEGNIVITANGVDYLIPVVHTVVDSIDLGMLEDSINFTDDLSTITRVYNEQADQLNIILTMTTYDYNSLTERFKELRFKIPLFNNKGELYVGRTLKKVMAELKSLSTINFETFQNLFVYDSVAFLRPYYKAAKVDLEITFLNTITEQGIANIHYNNLEFVKGRKPLKTFPRTAILNYHVEPLRVTPRSIALLNFYKTEFHHIRIYKNGSYYSDIPHSPIDHHLWLFKFQFSIFEPGDVVEIRIYKNHNGFALPSFYEDPDNYLSQSYIVFPEGKCSYHIAWEDEYGVLDMMEFTGDISYKMGYENNIIKDYESFKESLRKTDSKRNQNVVINTGFLLQKNPKRLDSLLSSKRAWIMDKGKEAVAMIPDTSTLKNYDSEQELYAFDIEFQINLNDDNKINS